MTSYKLKSFVFVFLFCATLQNCTPPKTASQIDSKNNNPESAPCPVTLGSGFIIKPGYRATEAELNEFFDAFYPENKSNELAMELDKLYGSGYARDTREKTIKNLNLFQGESVLGTDGPLHIGERVAIFLYTDNSFARVNKILRNKDAKKFGKLDELYLKALYSGLDRLPKHDGELYRGIRLDNDNLLNKYRSAQENRTSFQEFIFMSSSKEKSVAFNSAYFSGDTEITIKGKTGHDLINASKRQNEAEVLFYPCTAFKVKSLNEPFGIGSFKTKRKIYLEEVTE